MIAGPSEHDFLWPSSLSRKEYNFDLKAELKDIIQAIITFFLLSSIGGCGCRSRIVAKAAREKPKVSRK